jgi:hypothetical protein
VLAARLRRWANDWVATSIALLAQEASLLPPQPSHLQRDGSQFYRGPIDQLMAWAVARRHARPSGPN